MKKYFGKYNDTQTRLRAILCQSMVWLGEKLASLYKKTLLLRLLRD